MHILKNLTLTLAVANAAASTPATESVGDHPSEVDNLDEKLDLDHQFGDEDFHEQLGIGPEVIEALEMEMMRVTKKVGLHDGDIENLTPDQRQEVIGKFHEGIDHPDHCDKINQHLNELMEDERFKPMFEKLRMFEEMFREDL